MSASTLPAANLYDLPSLHFDTPQFHDIYVDVDLAQEWLLRNKDNRPHREALVRQYADDMSNGRWHFNGEPIQFSVTGRLINGQHRLKAVLRSQVGQRFMVGFGLPDDAQLTIDAGARRTAGDALALAGYRHTAATAAVAKLVINEVIDGKWITFIQRRPTTLHIHEVVERDYLIAEAGARAINRLPTHLAAPSVLGYCWWRLYRLDPDACETFFARLDSLDNLGSTSPILALNRRLTTYRLQNRNAGSTTTRQTELTTYIFTAWNAWRRHDERVLLKLVRTDTGVLRAPLPV